MFFSTRIHTFDIIIIIIEMNLKHVFEVNNNFTLLLVNKWTFLQTYIHTYVSSLGNINKLENKIKYKTKTI